MIICDNSRQQKKRREKEKLINSYGRPVYTSSPSRRECAAPRQFGLISFLLPAHTDIFRAVVTL